MHTMHMMGQDASLVALFLIGLLAGAPHCSVMCGGIVGMLSLNTNESDKRSWRFLGLLLGYNAGRIATYALVGAVAGALGAVLVNTETMSATRKFLLVIPILLTIALGLYIANIWSIITRLEHMGKGLWRVLEPYSRRFIPIKSIPQAVVLGAIWGWLPCGLVYSILLAFALPSGSAVSGATLMAVFGLGTMPVLLAVGFASSQFMQWIRHPILRRVIGLSIVALGILQLVMLIQR